MSSTFQQEVETQEAVNNLHRRILEIEHAGVEQPSGLMITLSPDFQMKVDTYCTIGLYHKDHERAFFGWPWFSVMGQEDNYQIWKRI